MVLIITAITIILLSGVYLQRQAVIIIQQIIPPGNLIIPGVIVLLPAAVRAHHRRAVQVHLSQGQNVADKIISIC